MNGEGSSCAKREDFLSRGNADDDGKKLVYIFHKNSHSFYSTFFIFSSSLFFCSYKVNGRISWRLNGTCNDKHVGLDGLQCQRYETNAISTHPETKATRSLHTSSSEF